MEDKLTDKQQRFVEEYCIDYNATQAAIRAGYSKDTAYSIGWENLRKPEIKKAVSERLEFLSMSAEEATKRLTDWGRGTMEHFVKLESIEVPVEKDPDTEEDDTEEEEKTTTRTFFNIDLTSDQAQKNLHLIKKVKPTRYGMEIELYDAKDAVVQVAKIRGLYVNKHEVTGKDGEALIPTTINVNVNGSKSKLLDSLE